MNADMRTSLLVALLPCVGSLGACEQLSGGPGPKQEVAETETTKLVLPDPPAFDPPKPNPDGTHSTRELRLFGDKYLEQPVKAVGYVIFIHDLKVCALDQGEKQVASNPKLCEGKKDVGACAQTIGQKIVDEHPENCDKPYFYLADEKNASNARSITVSDVTRPLRKDEENDPDKIADMKTKPPVPKIALGDQVTVDGTWTNKTTKEGFLDTNGLLVYSGVTPFGVAASSAAPPKP
jgi:hypothetical protein